MICGRVGDHEVDGPGLERLGPGLLVGDGLEGDRVQVGQARAPVVRVGRGGEVVVRDPLLEHEGPGADRVGRPVGVGQHGRRHHVGDLPADAAGQVEGEGHPGLDEARWWRPAGPVWVIDTRVGLSTMPVSSDFAWASRLVTQGGAVAGRAVVEDEVGPQRDRPRGVGGVRAPPTRPGTGPSRRWPEMMVSGSKTVRAYMTPDLVEAGRGGVEARLLGVDAEDERAALLGRRGGEPLRPGPLVTAPAMPSQLKPERRCPRDAGGGGRPSRQQRYADRTSRPSVLRFPEPSGPPVGSRATLVPGPARVRAVPLRPCRRTGISPASTPGSAAARRPPGRPT